MTPTAELRAWAEARTSPLDDIGPTVLHLLDLAEGLATAARQMPPADIDRLTACTQLALAVAMWDAWNRGDPT
jgi:hypothetical protein